MSRTEKDAPYEVRAKRLAKSERLNHDPNCGYALYNGKRHYFERVKEIFYSHETKELESFKNFLEEKGFSVSTKEKTGYLAEGWAVDYSFNDGINSKKRVNEKRISVLLDQNESLDYYTYSIEKLYFKKNIFVILEAVKEIASEVQCYCNEPTLPKSKNSAPCTCCVGTPKERKEKSKRDQRTKNRYIAKQARHLDKDLEYFENL